MPVKTLKKEKMKFKIPDFNLSQKVFMLLGKCLLKPKAVPLLISNDNVIFPKIGDGFD